MIRLFCLLLLSLLGFADESPKPGEEAQKEARAALADNSYAKLTERFNAIDVAARSGDAAFVPLLYDAAINSREPAFAVAAGEAANKLDPKAAVRAYDARGPKLRRLLAAQAVRFLGEVKSKDALRRLIVRSKSKEVEPRVEALYGIVKQGDEKANVHLLAAAKMRDNEVRVPAVICCGLAKVKEAAGILIKGLGDAKDDYAFYCAWALGQLQDPALLDKVASSLQGRVSGAVGVAKAKAIFECAYDAQAHVPTLLKLARHSDPQIAAVAAWSLGRLGKDSVEARDVLVSLALTSRHKIVAHMAVDGLGRIGTPELGRKILVKYESNPGKITQHIAKALGLLRTPEAAGLLRVVAYKNKSLAIRKQAAIAYWQCADKDERAAFQKRVEESSGNQLGAGLLLLGFDRSAAGFQFGLKLLRKHYGRKSVQFVRGALERMTGHRYSSEPGIWAEWWKQNSDFFERKAQLLDREAWRKQVLASKLEMGISKKTEAAVESGLAWLSRHQSLDGRWVGDRFYTRCTLYHRKKCQVGARLGGWDVGMSGTALLAFYGAGYRPSAGRYKDNVLRAQVFCSARQWGDGDFGGQGDLIGGYTRPIATIALAEAYGMTGDKEFLERAWLSASHIVRIQYADSGWRYRLGGQYPGDVSVTGWNAWAIATARKFGIAVDPMGLEGANTLIDMFSSKVTQNEEFYNHDPRYFFDVGRGQVFEHFTGYNAREETRPPMTAIGLICKIFMGRERSHPYCIGAANRLLKSIPEYDERNNKIKYTTGAEYPAYYWYYGSLAMYQMGGRFWRRWSKPLLTDGLPNTQVKGDVCEHGSWDCANLDSIGGRVYTTAMCVLTLETFYRYLPQLGLQ